MILGSSVFRRYFRREASSRMLAVLIVIFVLVQWGLHELKKQVANPEFPLERFIAASILMDAAAEDHPEWERRFAGVTRSRLWHLIQVSCESAEQLKYFPEECYPSWALAAHWFGDLKTAERLAGKLSPNGPKDRLILALIRNAEPLPEDLTDIGELYNSGSNDWGNFYLLDQLGSGDPALKDWMVELGTPHYRRNLIYAFGFWSLFTIGLAAAGLLLIRRKQFWKLPMRESRLPSQWPLQTVLATLFAGLLLGTLLSIVASFYPVRTPIAWLFITILTYLLYLGVPAGMLALILTPSPAAAARLFGLRKQPYPKKSIFLAGLGLAFVFWAASFPHDWIQSTLRVADLRPWLRPEALDSSVATIAFLVAAAVIAPLFEEVIFRGFLFRSLKNHLNPVMSAVLSTAFFATYHWYSVSGWIWVFLLGMLFCGIAHWSRTLWPGIIAHSLFNLVLTWFVWANYSF